VSISRLPHLKFGLQLMSAIQCSYGGSWESSRREYTLDDFYSLNLDKRDGYVTLRATNIEGEDWQGSDDEDDMDVEGDGDDDEDDDDSEDSDEDDEEDE